MQTPSFAEADAGTVPEPPRTSKLPRRVLAALLSLALVVGVVAAANGLSNLRQQTVKATDSTSAITGTSVFKAKQLAIKAKVIGGPLLPGVKRTLRVNLANKMSKPLLVSGVSVKVKKPLAAGCLPKWVTAKPFKATKKKPAVTIKPGRKASVRLPITLKNLPTVNQDACKSTRFPLTVTASARLKK